MSDTPNDNAEAENILPRQGAWLASRALLVFSMIAVGLLSLIYQFASPRIAQAEAEQQLKVLQQILPAASFDNNLLENTLTLDLPGEISATGPDTIWVARQQGNPVAVILPVLSREGYSGDIHMLVGIRRDGTLAGVRVTNHRETPGLGDAIDVQKSSWIRQFDGKSLGAPAPEAWKVRKDGGAFDQLTGATITPRAVVKAVRGALDYHAAHHDQLYAIAPPPQESQE